jgi:lysophospholipase L1-like esterase
MLAGGGVRTLDERLPVVLGEILGQEYETATFATGGWGTDQELLAFVQKGKSWDPDVVILCFTPTNDISNNLSNGRGSRSTKPYFVAGDDGLALHDAWGNPMEIPLEPYPGLGGVRSHALDFARYKIRPGKMLRTLRNTLLGEPEQAPASPRTDRVDPRYLLFAAYCEGDMPEKIAEVAALPSALSWTPQESVNHVSAFIHEDFEMNAYQWRLEEELLARLAREVDAIGARLVVMVLPVPFQSQDMRFVTGSDLAHRFETPGGAFTFRAAEPRDRIRDICARRGIECLDPTADFIRIVERDGLVEATWPDPTDIHFSGAGHRLLAELVRSYLADSPSAGSGAVSSR